MAGQVHTIELALESAYQFVSNDIWYIFFFLTQQFITWGAMVVHAYRRNYIWSINILTFLCSYPTQRTTKELNP